MSLNAVGCLPHYYMLSRGLRYNFAAYHQQITNRQRRHEHSPHCRNNNRSASRKAPLLPAQ